MAITVGVYLGKKDRFLRNWYDILPRGQFPLLVKYCIQSYLKGVYFPLGTICDSDSFRERLTSMQELSPTQRNVTFTKEDGPVFEWVEDVDNGYRSEEIKTILKDTIIHTLLEEHERTPLARQRYNKLLNGGEQPPVYEPAGNRMLYPWQEGGAQPDRRERWISTAVRESADPYSSTDEPGGNRRAEADHRILYRWQEDGPLREKRKKEPLREDDARRIGRLS